MRCAEAITGKHKIVVVEQGAPAGGHVTQSSKSGMFGKRGKINFEARWIEAVDGTRVAVRSTIAKRGRGEQGWAIAGAAILAWPLIFVRGGNANIPEGFEFTAYVEGNFDIDVPAAAVAQGGGTTAAIAEGVARDVEDLPADLEPLIVSDVTVFRASDKSAMVAFMVENPNDEVGLRDAHVSLTALDADENVVGGNTSLSTLTPEQTIYWLGPQQRTLFVKRMTLWKDYTKVLVHVSQSWTRWSEDAPKVTLVSTGLKQGKVVGEARNDSDQTLTIEVMVVLKEGETAVGGTCGVLKEVPAGQTKSFSLEVAGDVPEGATLEASAAGASASAGE